MEDFREVCKDLIEGRGKQWQIKEHVLKGNLWWIDFGEDCFNRGKELMTKDATHKENAPNQSQDEKARNCSNTMDDIRNNDLPLPESSRAINGTGSPDNIHTRIEREMNKP